MAFFVAGNMVQQHIQKSIIYKDSLSIVGSLSSQKCSNNDVINLVFKALMSAYGKNPKVNICWVQGHCGIAGNKTADQMPPLLHTQTQRA